MIESQGPNVTTKTKGINENVINRKISIFKELEKEKSMFPSFDGGVSEGKKENFSCVLIITLVDQNHIKMKYGDERQMLIEF